MNKKYIVLKNYLIHMCIDDVKMTRQMASDVLMSTWRRKVPPLLKAVRENCQINIHFH